MCWAAASTITVPDGAMLPSLARNLSCLSPSDGCKLTARCRVYWIGNRFRPMKLRRRQSRLIAFLALLGLLFQQFAMATYVCPIERTMGSVEASSLPPCHQSGNADRVRCHTHCHPLQASSDRAPIPTVPMAILPPTTWLRSAAWQPGPFRDDIRCEVTARATAPPLTIQHCTFQI